MTPRPGVAKFSQWTASILLGWLLAHWRGWAWLYCPECGWWSVSRSTDLIAEYEEHEEEYHLSRQPD